MRRKVQVAAPAFSALAALACRGAAGATPRSAAERFIDAFYVELSPAAALPFTGGSAESAVRESLRLQAEAGPRGAASSMVQPRVSWERVGEPEGDGESRLLRYRLRIDSGGVPLRREVTVRVERMGGDWKVTGFAETELWP